MVKLEFVLSQFVSEISLVNKDGPLRQPSTGKREPFQKKIVPVPYLCSILNYKKCALRVGLHIDGGLEDDFPFQIGDF